MWYGRVSFIFQHYFISTGPINRAYDLDLLYLTSQADWNPHEKATLCYTKTHIKKVELTKGQIEDMLFVAVSKSWGQICSEMKWL